MKPKTTARDRARARYRVKAIRGIPIEEISGYQPATKVDEMMDRYGERYLLARRDWLSRTGRDMP